MHYLPGARRVAGFLTMALLAGCSGSGGDESTRTEISTNAISFNAAGPDAATPTSQVITATFGSEIAHLAVVHSGSAVNTVTSTLNGRTATITVEPVSPGTVGPGVFIGAVAVTGYTCADATCSKLAAGSTSTVAVNYQVSPLVQLVTPYVATAGVSDEVVIRGIGFLSFNVTGVQFGDTAAASFSIVSNSTTEIRAVHPALPAGTYPVRLIASNFQGEITTSATLVVVDPVAYAATTLALPSGSDILRSLVYDAERRALLVVTDSGTGAIARYQYSGNAWNGPITQTAGFRDIALSAKGTGLYGITPTAFVPVDPVTLAMGASVAAPSMTTDSFLKNIVVGNDDIALITTGLNGTAQSNTYFYFSASNTLLGTGNGLIDATPAMAANGSIAYLISGHPTLTGDLTLQRYIPTASSPFSNSGLSHRQNRLGLAISRNSNRFVVNGVRVYDGSEGVVGLLPDTTEAIALKPDGTRAYTYDPTAGGILVYDISVDRDETAYVALGAPVPLVGDPGTNAKMIISPDGRTLFLAGGSRIVVQPTPAL